MVASSAATPADVFGPRSWAVNVFAKASRRSVPAIPVSSRWIARTHSWSGASSTTRVMIASAPGSLAVPARRSIR
jgi:hypothetical protein